MSMKPLKVPVPPQPNTLEAFTDFVRTLVNQEVRLILSKRQMESAPQPTPRELRTLAGWKLEAVSRKADVPVRTIIHIELGRRKNPRPATLAKIAKAIGVEPLEYRRAFVALIQKQEISASALPSNSPLTTQACVDS